MDVHSSMRIKGVDQDEELGFLSGCYGKPLQRRLTCSDRHFGDTYFGGYREVVGGGGGHRQSAGRRSVYVVGEHQEFKEGELESYSFLLLAVSP